MQAFAGGARLHTDDNALLEFAAARLVVRNPGEVALVERIEDHRDPDLSRLVRGSGPAADALRETAGRAIRGRGEALRANLHFARGEQQQALERLRAAARLDRNDALLDANLEGNLRHARALADDGRIDEAIARYRLLLDIDPDRVPTRVGLADVLKRSGRGDEARRQLEAARLLALAAGDDAVAADRPGNPTRR